MKETLLQRCQREVTQYVLHPHEPGAVCSTNVVKLNDVHTLIANTLKQAAEALEESISKHLLQHQPNHTEEETKWVERQNVTVQSILTDARRLLGEDND